MPAHGARRSAPITSVVSCGRPSCSRRARALRAGEIDRAALRAVEDQAIRGVVKMQEDAGLLGITDGEFRRTFFHVDFLEQLAGVVTKGAVTVKFHNRAGDVDFAPPVMSVTGKVAHVRPIQRDDFAFLASVTTKTPKVSIPSPTMLHFRGGRAAISTEAYPDFDRFFDDVAAAYRAEIRSLAAAGCRYLQLDDTNLAYLCDPEMRRGVRARGDDPDELPRRYARFINAAIADRPPGLTICVHLCRGNFKSAWVAEGGYEPVAEVLFNELAVDGLLPGVRRRALGRLRAAAVRAARQAGGAGAGQLKGRGDGDVGRARAADRRGGAVRAARAACAVAPVRLLEHGARQRHHAGGAGGEVAAGGGDGFEGVGRVVAPRFSTPDPSP